MGCGKAAGLIRGNVALAVYWTIRDQSLKDRCLPHLVFIVPMLRKVNDEK